MNPTVNEIIETVNRRFNPNLQYDFDNSGWQVKLTDSENDECTGVMICVDVTTSILEEAIEKGCNLIISHHPLIFRPLKKIIPEDRVGRCVVESIRKGISIFSCHTPCDVASEGVSFAMAQKLNLKDVKILSENSMTGTGLGVVGNLPEPMELSQFIETVKKTFGSSMARCSGMTDTGFKVSRIALGGGACSDLIPDAIEAGADVFITSDVKHNLFLDFNHKIILIDLGHYETEECTKEIFYDLLTKKFPNFALYCSQTEKNPITYL